jgi:hypothetical protein
MTKFARALTDVSVGISIAESEGAMRRGFGPKEVNQVTVDISRELIGQGASVVFGHDWRPDGVMEAVATAAAMAQPLGESKEQHRPLLRNYLPWPEQSSLSREEREQLASSLSIEAVGLPAELETYEGAASNMPFYRYLRARGLTELRHRLVAEVDARVCIGGKETSYAGRYPGIAEEALFTLEAGKPLYLLGAFEGATQRLIDALEGRTQPTGFARNTEMAALYAKQDLEKDRATLGDRAIKPESIWLKFRKVKTKGLANVNGLSVDENRELFVTSAIPTAIEIILKGLGRLRRSGRLGQ